MRSWCRETRDYLVQYIMEYGWVDPMGVVPPVWCGQPVEPLPTPAEPTASLDDA